MPSNICLQYLNYCKRCSYILILIHCKVDACKNNVFETDDDETNMPKDEDTDGLRECCSGILKLIEYGALFGLKLLLFKCKTK